MTRITITEALGEITLCFDKITKKEQFIAEHLVQHTRLKDPLATQGGSAEVIKQELQARDDLSERVVKLRRAISQANQANEIELMGEKRSIADWLVIRRELLKKEEVFTERLRSIILRAREQVQAQGAKQSGLVQEQTQDLEVHIDEMVLLKMIETITETKQRLDSQLSLKNARIEVEIVD